MLKDTKWQPLGLNPRPRALKWSTLPTEPPILAFIVAHMITHFSVYDSTYIVHTKSQQTYTKYKLLLSMSLFITFL